MILFFVNLDLYNLFLPDVLFIALVETNVIYNMMFQLIALLLGSGLVWYSDRLISGLRGKQGAHVYASIAMDSLASNGDVVDASDEDDKEITGDEEEPRK